MCKSTRGIFNDMIALTFDKKYLLKYVGAHDVTYYKNLAENIAADVPSSPPIQAPVLLHPPPFFEFLKCLLHQAMPPIGHFFPEKNV